MHIIFTNPFLPALGLPMTSNSRRAGGIGGAGLFWLPEPSSGMSVKEGVCFRFAVSI